MLIQKINVLTQFPNMKKKMTSVMRDKRKGKVQETSTLWNPKKAYATSKFVIVAKNGGHIMSNLTSSLVTVVRLADRQTKNLFWVIFKILN